MSQNTAATVLQQGPAPAFCQRSTAFGTFPESAARRLLHRAVASTIAEGFELLHRVHLPGQGQVVADEREQAVQASGFACSSGVEMDITPAMDAEVVANHKFAQMEA